ncbi:endonuclease/exonuclease/phosphatase family protein [Flexivirga meconopsidis]|uniref:endonuclease/exonuclease/phosphatase family protein n=1 Tax=Flexivirga meconopsidis TaxID=2977121 RepID=UPI003CC5542F
MRIITANVNGIRAAVRRGGLTWLAEQEPDVLTLQEVRAGDDQLQAALADSKFATGRSRTHRRPRPVGPGSRCSVRTRSSRCGWDCPASRSRVVGSRPTSTRRAAR